MLFAITLLLFGGNEKFLKTDRVHWLEMTVISYGNHNAVEAQWPYMVGAIVSGWSGPSSSLGRGHCVVFLGKTLFSHSDSLHPGV